MHTIKTIILLSSLATVAIPVFSQIPPDVQGRRLADWFYTSPITLNNLQSNDSSCYTGWVTLWDTSTQVWGDTIWKVEQSVQLKNKGRNSTEIFLVNSLDKIWQPVRRTEFWQSSFSDISWPDSVCILKWENNHWKQLYKVIYISGIEGFLEQRQVFVSNSAAPDTIENYTWNPSYRKLTRVRKVYEAANESYTVADSTVYFFPLGQTPPYQIASYIIYKFQNDVYKPYLRNSYSFIIPPDNFIEDIALWSDNVQFWSGYRQINHYKQSNPPYAAITELILTPVGYINQRRNSQRFDDFGTLVEKEFKIWNSTGTWWDFWQRQYLTYNPEGKLSSILQTYLDSYDNWVNELQWTFESCTSSASASQSLKKPIIILQKAGHGLYYFNLPEDFKSTGSFRLFDSLGRLVQERSLESFRNHVDLSALPVGFYFLTLPFNNKPVSLRISNP